MGFGRWKNPIKKIVVCICLVTVTSLVGKGLHWIKQGFTIRRVAASTQMKWEIWDNKTDLALSRPFRYLGRGRQCFAFESLDGKYVLKLPRTDIYQLPFWIRAFPIFSKQREALRSTHAAREQFVIGSMRIAYEELREETAVFALHFGQTPDLGKMIDIIDPLGIHYHLPAHKTAFVLQAKQPILIKSFLEALQVQDLVRAKQILDSFIDVVIARGKKGIWNKDGSFLRNYGFDGQKGYQIDIGSFYHKANAVASIRDTMWPVKSWLAKTDPSMSAYFDKRLEAKLELLKNAMN